MGDYKISVSTSPAFLELFWFVHIFKPWLISVNKQILNEYGISVVTSC